MLSPADHERVSAAIAQAERATAAEIYCVLDSEASRYREVPLAWASLVALVLPAVALLFGLWPREVAGALQGWTIGRLSDSDAAVSLALTVYLLGQAALFALTATIVSLPAVRRLATPGVLKRHRTHQVAQRLFVSTGVHLPEPRRHVLLYVARDDREIEILAEAAVEDALGAEVLHEAVAALSAAMTAGDPASGYVRAVEILAASLAAHFPAPPGDENTLPDTVVEI